MSTTIPAIEPIKVLAQAIQQELGLSAGQIMLGLENWAIPENTGLYVSLIYGVEQVVGTANSNTEGSDGNFKEVQSVAMLHQIEVDVMSFDSSARLQKEEVVMALSSYNAQQLMEVNSMRIASMPSSFVVVPSLEPSKQLNRYRFTISVYALHERTLATPYYDAIQIVGLTEQQ